MERLQVLLLVLLQVFAVTLRVPVWDGENRGGIILG